MGAPLRLLLVEGSERVASRLVQALIADGWSPDWQRVSDEKTLRDALRKQRWDVVVSGLGGAGFNGESALSIARSAQPETPVVVLAGAIDGESAADLLREGACDLVLASNLPRLAGVVRREMDRARQRGANGNGGSPSTETMDSLRTSEQSYRRLLEGSLQGVSVTKDGVLVYANDAFARIYGFASPRDAIGLNVYESIIAPEDRERLRGYLPGRFADGAAPEVYEFTGVRQDGTRRILLQSVQVITWDGAPALQASALDLTEQRLAERRLRESEARFRDFAEVSSDWYWETDADNRFSFLSNRFDMASGVTAEDVLGKTRWDFSGDVGNAEDLARNRELMLARQPFRDFTYAYRVRDGSVRYARLNGKPIFDDQGAFLGYRGTGSNVTAEILARRDAESAHRQLIDSIEALSAAFIVHDRNERFVLANSRAREFYPELVDVFDRPHTFEERMRIAVERGLVSDALGREEEWVADAVRQYRNPPEFREFRRYNGRWIRAYDRKTSDGSTVSVRVDITDLKVKEAELLRSEARFRGLLEQTGLPTVVHRDFVPLFANRAYARLFGFDSPESVLAHGDVKSTILPAMAEHHGRMYRERMAGRAVPEVFERQARRLDGSTIWVEVVGTRIDWEGEPAVLVSYIDITARKRAEEDLRANQRLLQAVFDSIPLRVAVRDAQLRFVMVNRHFAIEDRIPIEWYPGKTSWDFSRPTEAQKTRLQEQLRTVIETGAPVRDPDLTWTTGAGEVRFFDIAHVPFPDESGQVTGIVSVVQDMTERKKHEEVLRTSEKKFRDLIEGSIQGVFVHRGFRPLFVNRAFAEMYGFASVEDALRLSSLSELFAPHEVERLERQRAARERGEAPPERFEYEAIRKDGSRLWIETQASVIEWEGAPAILSTQVDISDRKRAENELRASQRLLQTVFDSLPERAAVKDGEGRFLLVNRRIAEDDGRPVEWYRGKTLFDLPNATEQQKLEAHRDEQTLMRTGRTVRNPELPWTLADGRVRTLDVIRIALKDEQGNPSGILMLGQDVTEARALREQLNAAQRMEAVGRLAGGVAHDFNNLLSVIISYARFALDALKVGDPVHADVMEIDAAAVRAANLTRQLLAFSRHQIQKLEVIDLNEVVSNMEKMMRRLIGEDVELHFKPAREIGSIKADVGQMEQVIMNLVVNARDAMPKGGVLTIETANAELDGNFADAHFGARPGSYVLLSVTDTGIGMDEATRQRIFEPFFTTKEQGKGTGLGLSTVYGIVKQSEGTIWVYSEPRVGTVFKLYFPRTEEAAKAGTAGQVAPEHAGHETILLVEDDESVRRATRRILEHAGYTVLAAQHGGEALLLAEKNRGQVDLMLTDVIMPQMSGRELADRLKREQPGLRVLFMSGYTDDAIIDHGVLDGRIRLLPKPFTRDTLLREVREVLDSEPVPAA